jgi:hypothetical protein
MMNIFKNKTTLVVIGGILIGVIAWYTLAGRAEPEGALVQSETVDGVASAEERVILDTLFQLRAIELSGTIFTNPAFMALRDFRTDIVAEPIGRRNPFAPLDALEGDGGGN